MIVARRILFLIDGLGALVTATFLAAILAQFESTFGMPSDVLYVLAAIALVFAVYSLTCYYKSPETWARFLRGIAAANLFYCMLTVALMTWFRKDITWIGVAYFVGEIVIIAGLAIYELIIARRVADR